MKLSMIQTRDEISVVLNRALGTPEKKLAYNLTDGKHSARDIAIQVGVSITSIHRWWREWQKLGIVTRVIKKGRNVVQKILSLEDLGIEVPEISSKDAEHEIGKIPNKKKLKSILHDSIMFKENTDLRIFAEKTLGLSFLGNKRDELIREIVDSFYNSPKRVQMMFMQALKQQSRRKGNPFKEYFESWEKHIKSEI